MDTVGDAEPWPASDQTRPDEQYVEVAPPPSLVTPEAWAVTSLTLSVASLLVTGLAQFTVLLLGGRIFNDQADQGIQLALILCPSGLLALGGVVAGLAVVRRRRSVAAWAAAVGTAGLVLGLLVAALTILGLVLALTTSAAPNSTF